MTENFNWSDMNSGDTPSTRLESVEEIRQLLQSQQLHTPTVKESMVPEVQPFRPVYRPPLGLLVVVDDGKDDGERIRLRADTFTIGRTEGDLIIAHDQMISKKHARLTREVHQNRYRWFLNDLQSSNGTFVRARTADLLHEKEFMLGSSRFRFNAALQAAQLAQTVTPGDTRTAAWQNVKPTDLIPSLLELGADGREGARHFLNEDSVMIGRGNGCHVVVDDPMMSLQHAQLAKNERGIWVLENLQAPNGTWIRLNRIAIDRYGQFMLGEQRFVLYVL